MMSARRVPFECRRGPPEGALVRVWDRAGRVGREGPRGVLGRLELMLPILRPACRVSPQAGRVSRDYATLWLT